MPRGVKSELTESEKYILHLERTKAYRKKRLIEDPEYAQKVRDYAKEYSRKHRELAKTEILLNKLNLKE